MPALPCPAPSRGWSPTIRHDPMAGLEPLRGFPPAAGRSALGRQGLCLYNRRNPGGPMKNLHISMIALGLAAITTAAWSAESVMYLVTSGEAVQKEVQDTKAASDAAVKRDQELAAEGNDLDAQSAQLLKENDAFNKENADINQRIGDYNSRCSTSKLLNQDQIKACKAEGDQLNADVAKVNADKDALNKHIADVNARIPKHNEEAKNSGNQVKATADAYVTALKNEGAWLDQARNLMVTNAFKSLGQKAGCPDVNDPAKTADTMAKMADDVIICLKKISEAPAP